MEELGNCRIFCMAKAEIVCFLHMGNEFEEVESGKQGVSIKYNLPGDAFLEEAGLRVPASIPVLSMAVSCL